MCIRKESPQTMTKPKGSSTISTSGTTGKHRHIPDLVQAFSEENRGLNQVLRRVKPPTCITVVYSSVLTILRGATNKILEKSVKSNSHEVSSISKLKPSCMIC